MASELTRKARAAANEFRGMGARAAEKDYIQKLNTDRTVNEFEKYGVLGVRRLKELGIDLQDSSMAMIVSNKGFEQWMDSLGYDREETIAPIMEKIEAVEKRQVEMDAKLDMILNVLSGGIVKSRPELLDSTLNQLTPVRNVTNRIGQFLGTDIVLEEVVRQSDSAMETIQNNMTRVKENVAVKEDGTWAIKWKRGQRPRAIVEALDIINEHLANRNIKWPDDSETLDLLLTAFLRVARYEGENIFSPAAMLKNKKYRRVYDCINTKFGKYTETVQRYVY